MKPIVELKQYIESADITKQLDGYIYNEIRKVAVDVDEERLLKALSDAHSFYYEGYEEGFDDGKRNAVAHAHWDKPIEHGLPYKANHLGVVCSECCSWSDNKYTYCPNCGARMDALPLEDDTDD